MKWNIVFIVVKPELWRSKFFDVNGLVEPFPGFIQERNRPGTSSAAASYALETHLTSMGDRHVFVSKFMEEKHCLHRIYKCLEIREVSSVNQKMFRGKRIVHKERSLLLPDFLRL